MSKITAKRSFHDRSVEVAFKIKASGWGHSSLRIDGSSTISTDEARALAAQLVALADDADAKAAERAAKEERRRAWRDREIQAGRIKVVGLR